MGHRGQFGFPAAHFSYLIYLLDHCLEPFWIIRRLAAHLEFAELDKLFGWKGSYLNRLIANTKIVSCVSSMSKRVYDMSLMCPCLFTKLWPRQHISSNIMKCTSPSATNSSLNKALTISLNHISPQLPLQRNTPWCVCLGGLVRLVPNTK